MGKKAQVRRGDTQPQIAHFTMSGDAYVAIRRYLGSKPHDECRELIMHLEAMPAITVDDIELREKQAAELAEFKADPMYSLENPDDDPPVANAETGDIVELTPEQEAELDQAAEDPTDPDPDDPVATDPEEE